MSENSADRAFIDSDDELNQIEDVHLMDFAQPNGDGDDYIDQLPETFQCLQCGAPVLSEGDVCADCEEIFA